MKLKRYFEYLYNPKIDVQERMFFLLSTIALVGLFIATLGGGIIGEDFRAVITSFVGFVVFLIISTYGIRRKKHETASGIMAFLIIVVYYPAIFFTAGGVYGGAPIWSVFATLFIAMMIQGRRRVFFFVLEAVVMTFCWGYQYFNGAVIFEHARTTVFLDSYMSLVVVSTVLSILVVFQTALYRKEAEDSEKQRKKIEALVDSQNRFFSSMSHEIRTPINTIIGLNEVILRQNASREINEDAANIQSASKMLLHLINDILDISKVESGQMELNIDSYHTGNMLSELVGMFWLRAKDKGLDFRIHVAPELPEVLIGDEVRIKQVLINVLNNAIKYTKKGSVELAIQFIRNSEYDGVVTYAVADTGIGIKKENIPYLFTAFKRVEEEKNRYIEGTGLGLSIVKQLTELMGGKITVNSVYTKGSTFVVEIPQRIADNTPVGIYSPEKQQNDVIHSYHQSFEAPEASVLVVDDTESNLMVVEKLLKDTKLRVDLASSGEEALKKTLDNEYQVILMDHVMPEMDGITCMHQIRTQIGGRSISARFICLTANAGKENERLYAREGFDGYLTKPVAGQELERELLRMLPKELVQRVISEDAIVQESVQWIDERRNKRQVMITTESVADLPRDVIIKKHISWIPYKIKTEHGVFRDNLEVRAVGALNYMHSANEHVVSMAPTEEEYEKFFANQLMRSNNIIHIAFSGRVESSGYPAAADAAKAFDNVFVFDSRQVSGGHGLVVLEACRLAEEGFTPAAILNKLKDFRERINGTFIVESLEHLLGQNRWKTLTSQITKAFMIRPMIRLSGGRLMVNGVFVGGRMHAYKSYVNEVLTTPRNIDKSRLMFIYSDLSLEERNYIRYLIRKKVPFEIIHETPTCPSISVNTGSGAFALFFAEQ